VAELIDNQHRRFCVRGVIRAEGRVLNAGRRVETAAVLRVLLRPYNLGGRVVETVDIELAAHDAVIELVSKSESRMGIFNRASHRLERHRDQAGPHDDSDAFARRRRMIKRGSDFLAKVCLPLLRLRGERQEYQADKRDEVAPLHLRNPKIRICRSLPAQARYSEYLQHPVRDLWWLPLCPPP
jgi:hypothetical protein